MPRIRNDDFVTRLCTKYATTADTLPLQLQLYYCSRYKTMPRPGGGVAIYSRKLDKQVAARVGDTLFVVMQVGAQLLMDVTTYAPMVYCVRVVCLQYDIKPEDVYSHLDSIR